MTSEQSHSDIDGSGGGLRAKFHGENESLHRAFTYCVHIFGLSVTLLVAMGCREV